MNSYEQKQTEMVEDIKDCWFREMPDLDALSDEQAEIWLRIHRGNIERILTSIEQTGDRHRKSAICFDHAIRFASRLMNALKFAEIPVNSLPDSKFFAGTERAA